MEKSRRIKNKILENKGMSKTQEKKRRRRKYPNVFFKKEITDVFDNIDNPKTMMGALMGKIFSTRQNATSHNSDVMLNKISVS